MKYPINDSNFQKLVILILWYMCGRLFSETPNEIKERIQPWLD